MAHNMKRCLAFFLLMLAFLSCSTAPWVQKSKEAFPHPGGKTEAVIPPPPESFFLTIVAAGDNIIHDPILEASYNNGVYSFDSIYEKIKKYTLPSDIAFVNQETILGNKALGYSGYPLFSTPSEAGAALAEAGFNVVSHATNHAMDKGEAGVLSTMDYWESLGGIRYLGIHRDEDNKTNYPAIINRNNFKIGFLAYTYGTNGISLPRGKPYLVSLINTEAMAKEIDALRPLCDFLVVSVHWGDEYSPEPSPRQTGLAAFFAEHYVDLVIGHHPHVLQRFESLPRTDGKSTLCFYSLGNFLSAHFRPEKEALFGGLAYVKLKKTGEKISVEKTGFIPTLTHYDKNLTGFTVYPLSEYSEELAEKHWKRANDKDMTLDFFTSRARELFGSVLVFGNPFER
jgi:poly-gamma-glutamate synthesis protein (capsule biosynthesis protein)